MEHTETNLKTGTTKQVFLVQAGEAFVIRVKGPNSSAADPAGIIYGSTFEYVAAEDRKYLTCVQAYTTKIDFECKPPMLVREDLNV
jgi:hypothetical protein